MYVCGVIWVNNKLLAGRKCDITVCTADIFKHRDYLVRGKSVFSYCGIIATFSPDAFIIPIQFVISVPVHTPEIRDGGREHSQKTLWSARLLFTTGSIVAPAELTESR